MTNSTGAVEFKLDGRPYVPAYINGEGPFWLLLDTGCIGCRITTEVVNRLGRAEKVKDDILTTDELLIGKAKWEGVSLGVYDETASQQLLGKPFDGFLGNGFLWYMKEQFRLAIDYPNRTLCFEPTEHPEDTPDPISVTLENYYTVLQVMVEETGPYRFLLDTGANRCAVSDEIAEKLKLPKGESKPARGGAYDLDAYESHVEGLSIGSYSVSNLTVSVFDCSLATSYVKGTIDGYIGTNFLEDFVVHFDYSLPAIALTESS